MKTLVALILLTFIALSPNARADGPDDQYVTIYTLIQQADGFNERSQAEPALKKYTEAETALKRFQKANPDWNPKVVKFRLKYLGDKISKIGIPESAAVVASIPAVVPVVIATNAAPATPTNVPVIATTMSTIEVESTKPATPKLSTETENQLRNLEEQIRTLLASNTQLQAKLKEALSAQPAAVDPRELIKAQDEIRNLHKQNDLLLASLSEVKTKVAPAPSQDVSKAQQALAESNHKVAQLSDANAALALEKEALQTRLNMISTPDAASASLRDENMSLKKQLVESQSKPAPLPVSNSKLQQELTEANLKLTQLEKSNSSLALEKDTLQQRLKSISVPDSSMAALREENNILRKQVTDLQSKVASSGSGSDMAQKLRAAQVQVAMLQSDKEILEQEKTALKSHVKQLSEEKGVAVSTSIVAAEQPVKANGAGVPAPMLDNATAAKIASLESQRDELQKSLNAATKGNYGNKKSTGSPGQIDDMLRQIGTLRARIEVLEAKSVPYSSEELALMSKPDVSLMASAHIGPRKAPKELPASAAVMLAEAKRYFVAHELDKAEAKYSEVLKLDEKNVATLSDLASIQLETGRVEEAEKNLKAALAVDPNDDYTLFVLGQLKFRQKNYDEAFDALSLAAQINPQNAKIQNFLGLTLSEKGLRGPAESAFRKAIQSDPGFADAHMNLAVVYITQQPPLTELAKWHYQKALATGHAPNPALEAMLDPKKSDTASSH